MNKRQFYKKVNKIILEITERYNFFWKIKYQRYKIKGKQNIKLTKDAKRFSLTHYNNELEYSKKYWVVNNFFT